MAPITPAANFTKPKKREKLLKIKKTGPIVVVPIGPAANFPKSEEEEKIKERNLKKVF